MVFKIILAALGIGLILFSGWGGAINIGNIIVGSLFVFLWVILSGNKKIDSALDNQSSEITKQTKEKTINGNQVIIEEETTTRKVTNDIVGVGLNG